MANPDDSRLSPAPSRATTPPEKLLERLRAAFRHHSSITQQRWDVRVVAIRRRRPEASETYCAAVELTGPDVDALVDVLRGAAELASPDAGRRGPNWTWIGSRQAAEIAGVSAATLRDWVSAGGPKRHPFPRPGVRIPGRNLWRRSTVEKWKAEYDALGGRGEEPNGPP